MTAKGYERSHRDRCRALRRIAPLEFRDVGGDPEWRVADIGQLVNELRAIADNPAMISRFWEMMATLRGGGTVTSAVGQEWRAAHRDPDLGLTAATGRRVDR